MKFVNMRLMLIVLFCAALVAFPPAGQSQLSDQSLAFSKEQLAQMLAPIALYPDALLTQVLMASTYPLEVVEADRWVKRNPELKGEDLDVALQGMEWDPSVKALCHFPTVLSLMSERIVETTNIGNAFLAQEEEVLAMVQELRARAYEQGNLKSTAEQKVIVEKETIIIEPADPRVVYVPYYDPLYIYGPWWYPAYPPYYWGPSRVAVGVGVSYWPGAFFSYTFGTWSYVDWPRHYIHVNVHKRPHYVKRDRWTVTSGRWRHVPRHRRGVAYHDTVTARKYGQYHYRFRTFDRDIRGFPDHGDRDRPRIDRTGRERERIDRERRVQDRLEQERRRRDLIERQRQGRERAEQERRIRQRPEQAREPRQRPEQVRPPRRPEQAAEPRQRPEGVGQWRERIERQRQDRERAERNIFNRVDEGRREGASSWRGRMSREGRRGDEARGRDRGGGGGEGRGSQGRGDGGGRGGWDRRRR